MPAAVAATEAPSPRPLRLSELCALYATATLRTVGIPVHLLNLLPPRKKQAFLISIGYYFSERWGLEGTHKDVMCMKELLINKFGYQEEEIYILSDSDDGIAPPTKQNIIDYLQEFIRPDENADYLFMYCGHSHQRPLLCRVPTNDSDFEEDNFQEFIIPSDALSDANEFEAAIIHDNTISDVKLRELLVKRLGPGNTLVAFFDTCHSETLLNLRHYRCNRVTSWASSLRRAGRRGVVEPWNELCRILPHGKHLTVNLEKQQEQKRCNGFCPRTSKKDAPQLLCVSACKDRQVTIESPDGGSMTNSIIALLETNPKPTLKELVRAVKLGADGVRRDMKKLHKTNKEFSRKEYLSYRLKMFFRPSKVERKPFHAKWSPQVSSSAPLDMKAKLNIGRVNSS